MYKPVITGGGLHKKVSLVLGVTYTNTMNMIHNFIVNY